MWRDTRQDKDTGKDVDTVTDPGCRSNEPESPPESVAFTNQAGLAGCSSCCARAENLHFQCPGSRGHSGELGSFMEAELEAELEPELELVLEPCGWCNNQDHVAKHAA